MAANNDTLGDCCTTGTLHEGTATGTVSTIAGLQTYVSGTKSDKIIVLITDVFGWNLLNTRLLADEYAKAGFYVLLPDFFKGDSLPSEMEHQMMPPESAAPRGFFRAFTEVASAAGKGGAWMWRHRNAVSRPLIDTFFTTLRAEHPSAKIGAVGFCWGGKYVLLLSHADAPVQVDCAVACHPSFVSLPNDIQKLVKPVSIQVGDKDVMFSVKQADQSRDLIQKKGIAGEVTVYPGMVHGFACRGDLSKSEVKNGRDQCTKATIAWFDKYLAPAKSAL